MSKTRLEQKQFRAKRVRRKITASVHGLPRLSVFKSNTRIIAQIINDTDGRTLAYATSSDRDIKGKDATEKAVATGQKIAKLAKDAGVEKVVFDRGASAYTGKVKAFADAAREGGLQF